MSDTMNIKILDDGTIQIETSSISGKSHLSADEFIDMIEDLAGGDRITKKKEHSHSMSLRSKDRKVSTFQK